MEIIVKYKLHLAGSDTFRFVKTLSGMILIGVVEKRFSGNPTWIITAANRRFVKDKISLVVQAHWVPLTNERKLLIRDRCLPKAIFLRLMPIVFDAKKSACWN